MSRETDIYDAGGEAERIIHNGKIVDEIPGVITEPLPQNLISISASPPGVEDVDPEALAGAMAQCISLAMDEMPKLSPMEIVSRLLKLKTVRGHKVVWTRFDINQLFALWTNKLDRQKVGRNG